MRGIFLAKNGFGVSALFVVLILQPHIASAQGTGEAGRDMTSQAAQNVDLAAIGTLLRQLETEVQTLKVQVKDLKVQQESAQAESAGLRKELEETRSQLVVLTTSPAGSGVPPLVAGNSPAQSITEDRIARLEEDLQLADAKIAEQSQTKVESGSKYRVRLTGIVLFNTYGIRGYADNTDFPQLVLPSDPLASAGSFGASVRQSQIGMQAFGPTIAGARTSGEIQFDFAGGFPETPNGVTFGIMRLRTGTIRFDWPNTSVVAGQDALFFAPLSPTSIATMAMPALAYSGNLWSWAPQVRVEHKFTVSESSSVLVQGGILDALSGDMPLSGNYRSPSWGEYSGQPAYAARVAWTQNVGGQNLTLGAGGYYGRQLWGYGRSVDSWAGTIDLSVPLGSKFEFTSQFYRGRAIGGLGG